MIINALVQQYAKELPPKDLRLIIQKVANIKDDEWFEKKHRELNETELLIFHKILQRRRNGEPVARIFEEWEFWGLPFYLSKETLVPRPDTETIIEAVLKSCSTPPSTILDLGTGSGCILISLLTEYPDAFGIGIDISKNALKTARRNAVRNSVFQRCEFIHADWSDPICGAFDIIVSNPPYIDTKIIESLEAEVRNFDPILALDGGKDGLDSIKIILRKIKSCMNEQTRIFFEIGYDQADNVMKLITDFGFSTTSVHKDLSEHQRVIEFSYGDKSKKNESQA